MKNAIMKVVFIKINSRILELTFGMKKNIIMEIGKMEKCMVSEHLHGTNSKTMRENFKMI